MSERQNAAEYGADEDDDLPCECGHHKDDHLVRIRIPDNLYGPCRAWVDKWHRCSCDEYQAEQIDGPGSPAEPAPEQP